MIVAGSNRTTSAAWPSHRRPLAPIRRRLRNHVQNTGTAWSLLPALAPAPGSSRHAVELREIERLIPFEPALGEHLELRRDQLGSIEASQLDKHEAGKTL